MRRHVMPGLVALVASTIYVQASTQAGDQVRRILIPGAGHFEIASPLSFAWPQVRAAIRSLLDGKLTSWRSPAGDRRFFGPH